MCIREGRCLYHFDLDVNGCDLKNNYRNTGLNIEHFVDVMQHVLHRCKTSCIAWKKSLLVGFAGFCLHACCVKHESANFSEFSIFVIIATLFAENFDYQYYIMTFVI